MITTRRPGSMSRANAAAARHSVRCSLAAAGNRTTWPGMGQKPDLLRARLALSRPLRLCGVMPARACLELHDRVDSRGISLRGAAIVGCLDLAGIEVPYPLRFDGCVFDSAPSFEGANLHELALTGCDKIPGLLANGIRVQRDLNLSHSRITGGLSTSASTSKKSAIWLCESEIGGRLLCTDTVIHASGERVLGRKYGI